MSSYSSFQPPSFLEETSLPRNDNTETVARWFRAVRIQDGPLRGVEAVFERKLDGTRRAVLLLKAMPRNRGHRNAQC